jgi:hypothetical protein
MISSANLPTIDGLERATVRAQGKFVLHFTGDVRLHLGDVFGGFTHLLGAVHFFHFGVGITPAEGGVVSGQVAEREA